MICLILAAGQGSRLRAVSESKPLTPIAGTPLIEHVARRAAEGGATGFVVVTGYAAEPIEAFLPVLAERIGLPIQSARMPDWTLPNGHSVLTGSAMIKGDYLLVMADHLLDPAILRTLIELSDPAAAVTLAVDRDLDSPLLDMDDATKVALAEDGAILAIGKEIAPFDAIDTGAFLATPALGEAIAAAVAAGRAGSLSEGMQQLAGEGRARTVDVTGCQWLDVDDPRALALADALVTGSAA